jgi:hypothetical protein
MHPDPTTAGEVTSCCLIMMKTVSVECSEVNVGTRNLKNEFGKHSSQRTNSVNQTRTTEADSNIAVREQKKVQDYRALTGEIFRRANRINIKLDGQCQQILLLELI